LTNVYTQQQDISNIGFPYNQNGCMFEDMLHVNGKLFLYSTTVVKIYEISSGTWTTITLPENLMEQPI